MMQIIPCCDHPPPPPPQRVSHCCTQWISPEEKSGFRKRPGADDVVLVCRPRLWPLHCDTFTLGLISCLFASFLYFAACVCTASWTWLCRVVFERIMRYISVDVGCLFWWKVSEIQLLFCHVASTSQKCTRCCWFMLEASTHSVCVPHQHRDHHLF